MKKYASLPFTHFVAGDLIFRGDKIDTIEWLALHVDATGLTSVIVATCSQPFTTTLDNITFWSK
jgi:EamA domain-containing membrane protein RarD